MVITTPAGTDTRDYTLSGLTLVNTYTQAELESMTVTEIKALAAEKGYTITTKTKAAIIEEFLEQQNG